jgi:uncharacterized phage protein (TIGR01671 family)
MKQRDIKFRAWDGEFMRYSSDYEEGHLETETEKVAKSYSLADFFEYNPNCEFMQFTGLKDKNGKEIYEGDVINDSADTLEVIYNSSKGISVGWYVKNNTTYLPLCVEQGDYMEIIGNIYENPELCNH